MTIPNHTVSIAYAVISMAASISRNEGGKVVAGVISSPPGMGVLHTSTQVAAALGMEVLEIRMPHVEYHPGSLDLSVYEPAEKAFAAGGPVLIMLDEASSAQAGVIECAMKGIATRVGQGTCAVLANAVPGKDLDVALQMADGLGVNVEHIMVTRSNEEMKEILERLLAKDD